MTNTSDFCPLVRELDASTKFFIWDFDIVCAFFAGLSIGIMVASLMLGALLGLIFAKGLSRLNKGDTLVLAYTFCIGTCRYAFFVVCPCLTVVISSVNHVRH